MVHLQSNHVRFITMESIQHSMLSAKTITNHCFTNNA